MPAVGNLPVPEQRPVGELPVPEAVDPVTPEQADARGFVATAGQFRRGLRSSVNSLGASAQALAGQIGEAMGLTDFAASRFEEAKDFAAFADAVGPRVRDYRAVKDDVDIRDYLAGLAGQGVGSTLPAVAGAALGARFGIRGAVAGAFPGSFVPNAGENVMRLREAPGTSGEKLAGAAGAGLAQAGLDIASLAVPGAVVARGLRGAAPRVLPTVGKSTAAEMATEPTQEAIGQALHTSFDPSRDKSEDTPQLVNAAIGGAVGGATVGGAASAAAMAPGAVGSLRERFKRPERDDLPADREQTVDDVKDSLGVLERPVDPDDVSQFPDDAPVESLPEWMDLRENEQVKGLARGYRWLQKHVPEKAAELKDWATDGDVKERLVAEVNRRVDEVVEKPAMQRAVRSLKAMVAKLERPDGERRSRERTQLDLDIYDDMVKSADPKKLSHLTPTEKLELASSLKSWVLHSFAQRDPVEGPMPAGRRPSPTGLDQGVVAETVRRHPVTGEQTGASYEVTKQPKTGLITEEQPRQTVPAQVPHVLMDIFGDRLVPLAQATYDRLKAGAPLRKVDLKKGIEKAQESRQGYQTKLEGIVKSALRDQFVTNPATRDYAVRQVTRELQRDVTHGPAMGDWDAFNAKMNHWFGPKAEEVLEQFDAERENITREYEEFAQSTTDADESTTKKDIAERLAENERFSVSRGDMTQAERENAAPDEAMDEELQDEVPEDSVHRDKRLGVPYTLEEAEQVLKGLRADPAYPSRQVSFRADPVIEEYTDDEGNVRQRMTNKYTLHAEDAQAKTGMDEEQWKNLRDKYGKSGLNSGVVTVTRVEYKRDEAGNVVRDAKGDPVVLTDKKPWKVSIPSLTAEAMRSIGREGGDTNFVHDMVLRGIGMLLSDPGFTGFSPTQKKALKDGMLHLPDDTPVYYDQTQERALTWGEVSKAGREGLRQTERDYWQGIVSDLNDRLREFEKRRAKNPAYEDEEMEQFQALRQALEAAIKRNKGVRPARDAYNQFVREWAQEREERASGFQSDDSQKGMIGVRAIEDAFNRERREEQIEKEIRSLKAQIKNALVERPEGVDIASENRARQRRIRRLEREREEMTGSLSREQRHQREVLQARIRQASAEGDTKEAARLAKELREIRPVPLSETLRENEIEQTSPIGARPEQRNVQEETREPLLPQRPMGAARAKAEIEAGKVPGGPVRQVVYTKSGGRSEKLVEPGKDAPLQPRKKDSPDGIFSEMRVGKKPVPDEVQEEVRTYVKKVLGPRAQTFFAELEKGAGLFEKVKGVDRLTISIRALDARSVGFHEAFHGLMDRLAADHPEAANTLLAAASSPHVMAQLRKRLAKHPEALEQLEPRNPRYLEERAAYMYQLWAAKKLDLGPKTESVMDSLRAFFRRLLSVWTELSAETGAMPAAEKILEAFHSGRLADRSRAGRVLDMIAPRPSADFMAKLGDMASKVLFTADGYVRSFKISAYTGIADKFMSPADQPGTPSGLMQVKHIKRNEFMNRYVAATRDLDEDAQARVMKALRTGKPPAAPAERGAYRDVRRLLDDLFDYMVESDVRLIEWDPLLKQYRELELNRVKNYFPRAYDREAIEKDWDKFVALLESKGVKNADVVAERLVSPFKADPNETDFTAGLTYYAPETMQRKLKISDAELAPFLRKDLGGTMYQYVNHVVRRAEYTKRFGNQGEEIALAMEKARQQGATPEQEKSFSQYVQAMEGSLGNRMDPKLRGFFGAVMTYQNLRLLPLALFSSLVDPTGLYVRGASVGEALSAFTRGVRELVANKEDDAREFARTVGAINEASEEQMIADAYGANYASGWQRKMNNLLFRMNGMESWNNSMRIAAASAAERFIMKHAKKKSEHSERWLAELGLKKEDVTVVKGRLDLTPAVVDAINKWVDGAVLRPHAGVRPIWMSDPHFMLISHLKQFTYSFQKTIVARAVHEAQHGNYNPAVALASYVPLIIAADIIRAMVTPGGSDDDRLKRWGVGDWLTHGIMRAGVTGPGQYAFDAGQDLSHGGFGIEAVLGPSVEQLVSMLRAAAGAPGEDFTRELLRSVPPVPALNIKG